MRPALIRWQWEGYPEFHRSRGNLWLHLFAVPAFVLSTLSLVASLVSLHWGAALGALIAMAIAFGVQAIGHGREAVPAIPFAGPLDAVSRICAEQFINFPRFVSSGGWLRALRGESFAPSRLER